MICLKKTNLWVMSCISLSFRQQLTHLSLSPLLSPDHVYLARPGSLGFLCDRREMRQIYLNRTASAAAAASQDTCTHSHTLTHTNTHRTRNHLTRVLQTGLYEVSPGDDTVFLLRWFSYFRFSASRTRFFFQTSGKKISKLTLQVWFLFWTSIPISTYLIGQPHLHIGWTRLWMDGSRSVIICSWGHVEPPELLEQLQTSCKT